MSEPTLLQSIAGDLAAFVIALLESIFGSGMRAKVWGEVTWGDLATSGILLLLVMIAGVAVRAWLDVLKRRQAAKEGGAGWRMETVSAVAKPLLGLIWLYGIVAAVLPLVAKIDDRNELRVQFALEKIIDIGAFAPQGYPRLAYRVAPARMPRQRALLEITPTPLPRSATGS